MRGNGNGWGESRCPKYLRREKAHLALRPVLGEDYVKREEDRRAAIRDKCFQKLVRTSHPSTADFGKLTPDDRKMPSATSKLKAT
jgi:hypothetical protein